MINNTFHRKLFYTATKTSRNSGIFYKCVSYNHQIVGVCCPMWKGRGKEGERAAECVLFFTHALNIRIPFFLFPHYENVLLKCVHLRIGREQRQKEHNFSSALDE